MNGTIKLTRILLSILFLFLLTIKNAYAYLDPGSGNLIFQLLIAGLMGAGFALKVYWKKVVAFIKGLFGKKESVDEDFKEEEDSDEN